MNASVNQSPAAGLQLRPLRLFLEAPGVADTLGNELNRLLPYAAAYALLHGLLVMIGFMISTVPSDAVAIWPAVGMLSAALVATPRRTWPLWILSSIVGRIAFELLVFDNRTLFVPIVFSTINIVEAIFFAFFMQRPLVQLYSQGRPLYLSITITIMAVLAANIGGALGGIVLPFLNLQVQGFWETWRVWASGDFVGMILVAPLAVWMMLPQIRIRRHVAGWLENAAMLVSLLLLVAAAVFLAPEKTALYASAVNVGLASALALPVLWAALRAEFPMVAVMQIMLAFAVVMTASFGLGPFAHDAKTYLPNLAALQLFLTTLVIVVTTVSFAVLERQKAQQESTLHQRFSDLVVVLTNKLMRAGSGALDNVITDSLRLIATFAHADRCGLLQMGDEGVSTVVTHRWTTDGVGQHPTASNQMNLNDFPWVIAQFRAKGYLILQETGEPDPDRDEVLKAIRQVSPEIVSAIYVALFSDERIIGAIGYDYKRHDVNWSNESISLMFIIGQLFANILQRKRTETDLELYRNKLRSLAKEMSVAEERARRRTAIDLHDSIGQNLAVARMKVGQLLANEDRDEAALTQMRNLIDEALRGTRFIISDLSPSILYELGLVPALQSLAERFDLANDLTCHVEETGQPWEPGNDMRIALYRAVQECLNNVARHAQAQTTVIRVAWFNNKLDIDVVDDGIGFEVRKGQSELPSAEGFGLFSMRESMGLLGGSLTVESAAGIGTTVSICVPRQHKEDDE